MIVNLGSNNPVKYQAIEEEFTEFFKKEITIKKVNISSDVSEQPISLEETINGARNRAINAFKDCTLSVGVEGGLMQANVPTNYLQISATAIYDGKRILIGLSPGFEHPAKVIELVNQGLDISQAYKKSGLTSSQDIGIEGGAIAILSNNQYIRKDYIRQAIKMAFLNY